MTSQSPLRAGSLTKAGGAKRAYTPEDVGTMGLFARSSGVVRHAGCSESSYRSDCHLGDARHHPYFILPH